MGLARDVTGNYQRGLLTMAIPMLVATGIMLYLCHLAQTSTPPVSVEA
jgi:ACS family tartrate transporter-like MFS transporter